MGCSDDGCIDGTRALPHAALYRVGSTTQISIENLAVYAIGAPGDTLIEDTATLKEFYLPLRPSTDRCSFVLDYTDLEDTRDTITVKYEGVPFFVSEDCGVSFFFNITEYSYTQHVLQQVDIPDLAITNVDRISVKIYYPVASSSDDDDSNDDTTDESTE